MQQIIEIKKNKSNYVQIELREYEGPQICRCERIL